ncbi:MAG: hypothetical protein Q4B36_05255 [Tissierellia bacterium]|nr:hypothetical protein [Tissierellia bacterium]
MKKNLIINIFLTFVILFSLSSCRAFNSTTQNGEIEYTEDNTALETGVEGVIKDYAKLDYLSSYDGKVIIKIKLDENNKENYDRAIEDIRDYILEFEDDEWNYIDIEVEGYDSYEYSF